MTTQTNPAATAAPSATRSLPPSRLCIDLDPYLLVRTMPLSRVAAMLAMTGRSVAS